MKKIVCDLITGSVSEVDLTVEEIVEVQARAAAYVPPTAPAAPTKEQLLAELQTLTAKINALE
jgi:hypothetical protein